MQGICRVKLCFEVTTKEKGVADIATPLSSGTKCEFSGLTL